MKAYKFDKDRSAELADKLKEVIGQMTLSDLLTLSQQIDKSVSQKAEVHFASAAYYKMLALVDKCDKEIAWDGLVYRDEENPHIFYVTDIIVYPQTVTGATVETDDELYLNWLNSLDDETYNHRRFNGHSHVNMAVSPSGTDTTYREQSILNINDFFIFGIFNKKHDFNFQIYDVENNIIYDKDDIIFYTPEPDYDGWALQVIQEHVKVRTYTAPKTNYAAPSTTTPATTTSNHTPGAHWYQETYGGKDYTGRGYDYYDRY